MTLIITAFRGTDVLQVSDRRLTQEIGKKVTVFDAAANKTVVVRGSDYAVSMSYTGLAYINDKPTDVFLAEQVIGQEVMLPASGAMSSDPYLTHLQGVADRVRVGIDRAYASLKPKEWRTNRLQVVLSGLQQRSPRPRRVLWIIDKRGEAEPAEVHKFDIDDLANLEPLGVLRSDASYRFLIAGDHSHASQHELEALLHEASPKGFGPFFEALHGYVRLVGSRSQTIGQDVMGVVFGGVCDHVLIRYVPDPAAGAKPRPAYTPWTITPHALWTPSVIESQSATSEWATGAEGRGGVRFTYEGPVYPPEVSTVIYRVESQRRASPPR